MNKYGFYIEKRSEGDRIGRNLVVYAKKDSYSYGLPSLTKGELEELAKTINEYLKNC